jgi:hypothetical protein
MMPLKTLPFDPADYLYDEEDLALYLEDARAFGADAVADAMQVIARARARIAEPGIVSRSPSVRQEALMARNTGNDYRRGAVTGRTQFQQPNGDWQKRDERTGQFMERKSSEGPFKGVAREPDGRDGKD